MLALSEVLNSNRVLPLKIDTSDPQEVDRYLIDLPKTDGVIAELARLAEIREQKGESRAVLSPIARLNRWKELCEIRDSLMARRPEGCWCLGFGGRGLRYGQDGGRSYSEFCTCPEGEEQKHQFAIRRAAFHAALAEQRATRLFDGAHVPARFKDCTIASFPVTDKTQAAVAAIRLWIDGPSDDNDEVNAWAATRKKSLLLHGLYGVGKTGLAVGILREEVSTDGGLFFTVPTLLDHIRRTYGPNPVADEHEIVEEVKSTPFLVLDDLGAERVTEWVREKLFTIINHRHDEDLPTVFTSNLDIPELGAHIGERTTWRIVEMAHVIHIEGPNLRAIGGAS